MQHSAISVALPPCSSRNAPRRRRASPAHPAAGFLLAATALAACGPGARAPTGEFVTPHLPDEREGFVAVAAPNPTVRPERRDFSEPLMRQLRLPAGFEINLFAQELAEPRRMRVAENGDVYVAEREEGRVRLLRDTNGVIYRISFTGTR